MKRFLSISSVLATLLVALLLSACGDDDGDGDGGGADGGGGDRGAAATGPAPEVSFTTDGATFTGPASASAGWVKITLANQAQAPSHMALIRLFEGRTPADLATAIQQAPDGPLPNWATPVGGPGPVDAGASESVSLNLVAGDYALLRYTTDASFISRPDVTGIQPFSVTGTGGGGEPTATVLVTMFDFGYVANPAKQVGVTLMAPIDAGDQVLKITNDGPQIHSLSIVEIEPGKSTADFDGWIIGQDRSRGGAPRVRILPDEREGSKPSGPPPGKALGGTTAIMPGQTAYLNVSLSQGNYFLFCSLLDAETGQSHVFRRMIHEFQARTPLTR